MRLATKISVAVVGVVVLAVLSGVITMLFSRQVGGLMQRMAAQHLPGIRAAAELEIALLEQGGLVASYILDAGDRTWLDRLEERKPEFDRWLFRARETAQTAEERKILDRIAEVYRQYDTMRSEVISCYRRGDVGQAREALLRDMAVLYSRAYTLCEDYIATNERQIEAAVADGRRRIRGNALTVGMFAALTGWLGLGLLYLFFRGVLSPLRRMAEEAEGFSGNGFQMATTDASQDDLRSIGFYLQTLMSDVAETRSSLDRSRSRLMNAEKLASVGRLAASVAHEIRNPLTSLRLRLFSIRQALGDDPMYEDDLRVVSEEVSRLERIIRNFLEFSRPPELRPRAHNVSFLTEKALELVGPQFEDRDIEVLYDRAAGLPRVIADSDQIKQVFINLLTNAADAMERGGKVRISTAVATDGDGRRMVAVRFQDNGPGIPEESRERIFEPFFSTKEDGTGLGLCIAAQIMAQHDGRLELESSTDRGASFAVWIPAAQEGENEQGTGR